MPRAAVDASINPEPTAAALALGMGRRRWLRVKRLEGRLMARFPIQMKSLVRSRLQSLSQTRLPDQLAARFLFAISLCGSMVVFMSGCDQGGSQPTTLSRVDRSQNSESVPSRLLDDATVKAAVDGQVQTEPAGGWLDGTEASGVRFTYFNGREGEQFTILESVGGGVALFDLDADGDLDLFFPGGGNISATKPLQISGRPAGVFRNDGQGKFVEDTQCVHMSGPDPYSHGAFVADFNRDGWADILMTCYQGVRLLQNEQGKRLVDVTASSGLILSDWTTAGAWADVDRDGWPDLLIVGYVEWDGTPDSTCGDRSRGIRDVCPPQKYQAARQRLYKNNKDGTFSEIENGLAGDARGKGLGVVALDLNGDHWIDFYVANDQVANQLYLGGPRSPMREVGVVSATSGSELGAAEGSMGVDAEDYDGDGLPDLWVTNYEREDNSLYRNLGKNLFDHSTIRAGLGGVGRSHVKFGTGLADFDLDGWLDLFFVNGHVLYKTGRGAYLQPAYLLRNEASGTGRRFRDVTRECGGTWFREKHAARGAAVGDLDNDGDLDLVVVQQNMPVSVLYNQTDPKTWLCVELRGVESDPVAVGASIRYRFEGRDIVRHVRSGAGYLSQFDQRIYLPVVSENPLEVTVTWLTGKSERYRDLQPRVTNRLMEGRGEPQ